MAIAVVATRNALCDAYKVVGGTNNWVGVATGNPGSSATPSNEATGGAPAYARQQAPWGTSSGGTMTAPVPATINVPTGLYTHILLASGATGANMTDNADVTDVNMSAQGQIVITPTYTQT